MDVSYWLILTMLPVFWVESSEPSGWTCLVEEGKDITLNCTGAVTGNHRGVRLWWTANKPNADQSNNFHVLSRCYEGERGCVNHHSDHFSAEISGNRLSYRSQLKIHKASLIQRHQEFRCVDWNNTMLFSCILQVTAHGTVTTNNETPENNQITAKNEHISSETGIKGEIHHLKSEVGNTVENGQSMNQAERTIIQHQSAIIIILVAILACLLAVILLSKMKGACRGWRGNRGGNHMQFRANGSHHHKPHEYDDNLPPYRSSPALSDGQSTAHDLGNSCSASASTLDVDKPSKPSKENHGKPPHANLKANNELGSVQQADHEDSGLLNASSTSTDSILLKDKSAPPLQHVEPTSKKNGAGKNRHIITPSLDFGNYVLHSDENIPSEYEA